MTLEEENGRPHAKSSTTQARAVDPEGLRSDKPLTHRGRHPARDINAKSPRAIRWCLDSGVEVFLKGVLSGKPEGIQARRHRGGWLRTREHGECATALEGVWGEAELLERVFDPPGRRPQHRGGADDDGRGDGRMADDGLGRMVTAEEGWRLHGVALSRGWLHRQVKHTYKTTALLKLSGVAPVVDCAHADSPRDPTKVVMKLECESEQVRMLMEQLQPDSDHPKSGFVNLEQGDETAKRFVMLT
eukprot:CAMPEP_0175817024 /NCGR_PEP_ID=MMETSP0107_2-20121207/6800_1 /TAXON_ID=195067 ORGANISM="Goniomonas pacifica, Strain CCMP1869" /NCGR_SAMPLE_ID=MMETSP0107_2 /ASSEMBLY_ACC=CAM_ASM_000203 /LENGTH=244 /DNA_ID=CAMNT_0017129147 /DNA_START=228 /DNA_END=961 /DNA_ORIENTATION=-